MSQHEMIRNKMKSTTIAPKIKRMIGMMPAESLRHVIINPPDTSRFSMQTLLLRTLFEPVKSPIRIVTIFCAACPPAGRECKSRVIKGSASLCLKRTANLNGLWSLRHDVGPRAR